MKPDPDTMKKNIFLSRGEVVIYRAKNKQIRLEVKLEKETVWLTQKQIADLFRTDRSVITRHINNIFKFGELSEKSNVQKMHVPFSDKPVKFYDLDIVISVGYRVNSELATQFRIWATKVLKDHLIQGYTLNQKRLLEQNERFKELQNAISFLQEKSGHLLLQNQPKELLSLLDEYSKSFSLLDKYDKKTLTIERGEKAKFILTYKNCLEIIAEIKIRLMEKKEASILFGQEIDRKFENIISNLYQTFGREELYPSIEEKSAHLLYLVIKDHPFVDGNKRIASILFIYFLEKNKYLLKESGEKKINDNALISLSLLIAVSEPKEKDTMIKIITNLLR